MSPFPLDKAIWQGTACDREKVHQNIAVTCCFIRYIKLKSKNYRRINDIELIKSL